MRAYERIFFQSCSYHTQPLISVFLQTEPSKAPSTVIAFNTSSTSIAVTWGEVPIGYLHGILQGYVIQYKKLQNLANNNWTTFTISANISNATITSLDKYTHYVIKVMAFTVVGRGPSRNVTVSTDEDGKLDYSWGQFSI